MGLMYLASALRSRGRHEVRIIDTKVEGLTVERTVERIREESPDVVGLTAMTYEARSLHGLAGAVKAIDPSIRVLAGGPHATNNVDATLADRQIDYVVKSEGEDTLVDLMDAMEANSPPAGVRGIAYRENGAIRETAPRPYIEPLDRLPFPAWDRVPVSRYFSIPRGGLIYKAREFMTIFSSRACPYRCIYCHNNLGKTYRPRSPENLVEEIEALVQEYGVRELIFMDDMFNLIPQRVHAICRLILERSLKVHLTFPNGLRADLLDEETLRWLKRAGMYRCLFAIETASPRLQKLIKKNVDFEKTIQAIRTARSLGILTHGAFMLGFPTETEEEMLRTVRFATEAELHTAAFFRVMPFKGSELYRMAVESGVRIEEDWDSYEYYKSPINLSAAPEETLTRIRKAAYRRFYLSPRRLVRLFWRLPNKRALLPYFALVFIKRAFFR